MPILLGLTRLRLALPQPRKLLPLLAALLPLILGSCTDQSNKASSEPVGVRVVPVKLAPDVVVETGTGEVRARIETNLSFNASGRVLTREVDAGDRVKAGQLLATLDSTEQSADVEAARAAISAQEATVRVAESVLNRRRTLTETGVLPQQDLDQAIQDYESAVSDLDAAKARLATSEDRLTQTELRSNADGVITSRNIEPGEVVQPSTVAFTLAQGDALDAVFNVQEAIFTRNTEPASLEVSLLQRPEIRAKARLREISPTVDRQLGTVRIKMEILDPPVEMTLGSAVVAHVEINNGDRVALPWSALTSVEGDPAVWIVNPNDSTVEARKVEIERYDTDRIVLSGGLSTDEQVVFEGVQFLRPNLKVSILTGDAS